MEKDFQTYLIKELDEIKGGVHALTTEFQEYKTCAAEKYATKDEHEYYAKEREDAQRGVFGWIIGAYAFIMSVAIALFTTIMKK